MRTNSPRPAHAPRRAAAAALLLVAALGACDRKKPATPADSTPAAPAATAPVESTTAPALVSGWDREVGTALLVPGDGGEALVVVPGEPGEAFTDRTAGRAGDVLPAEVALFSRAGASGRARATAVDAGAPNACGWPTARLGPASGADALPAWTVGFVGGAPTPVALDSLEGATARDSAALAATVTRLAGSLADDTVRAFRGVPFTVRSARRFAIGDGREGLVAVLTRALAQEASPLAEHLLLVAERPRAAAGGASTAAPWAAAYHERDAGREDAVPATEVLAAATLGAGQRPALVLARALADGSRYALLERTGEREWRVRWTSAVRGC